MRIWKRFVLGKFISALKNKKTRGSGSNFGNSRGENENEKPQTHTHLVVGVYSRGYFITVVPWDCDCLRRTRRILDSGGEEADRQPARKD